MAHSHRNFYSLAHVVHLVASAAMFAVGAASRAVGAFVGMVLSTAPPQPMPQAAPVTPMVTGLHQARAFTERRIFRAASRRARAPDSVAFVTA